MVKDKEYYMNGLNALLKDADLLQVKVICGFASVFMNAHLEEE